MWMGLSDFLPLQFIFLMQSQDASKKTGDTLKDEKQAGC